MGLLLLLPNAYAAWLLTPAEPAWLRTIVLAVVLACSGLYQLAAAPRRAELLAPLIGMVTAVSSVCFVLASA
jgi:hypothetical protein